MIDGIHFIDDAVRHRPLVCVYACFIVVISAARSPDIDAEPLAPKYVERSLL
jgi:hypothetical protein